MSQIYNSIYNNKTSWFLSLGVQSDRGSPEHLSETSELNAERIPMGFQHDHRVRYQAWLDTKMSSIYCVPIVRFVFMASWKKDSK